MKRAIFVAAVMMAGVAQGAVQFGVCPFGLVAAITDGYASTNPYVVSKTWTTGEVARYALIDQLSPDTVQSGFIEVQTSQGGPWVAPTHFAINTANHVGQLFPLGTAATHGARITVNTPSPGRAIWRVAYAEFLAENPGVNLALGAAKTGFYNEALAFTATAIGTGANPDRLFDGQDSAYWRASSALTTPVNYAGVVFDTPVIVDALRFDLGMWSDQWRWTNFDLEVRYGYGDPDADASWTFVGQANIASNFYWVGMGGMEVTGVRLIGRNNDHFDPEVPYSQYGNNPGFNSDPRYLYLIDPEDSRYNPNHTSSPFINTLIVSEMQVWGRMPVVPEPATMSLLALGGLAMLRRRR